jgi:hypothetical protein
MQLQSKKDNKKDEITSIATQMANKTLTKKQKIDNLEKTLKKIKCYKKEAKKSNNEATKPNQETINSSNKSENCHNKVQKVKGRKPGRKKKLIK